jgi:hypothetical protein
MDARAAGIAGNRAMRRAVVVALGAATALASQGAYACTVCFGGQPNDWTGGFFLGTVVMLSLPPLIVVGAGIAIYRAIKRQEVRLRERDAQRAREVLAHRAS